MCRREYWGDKVGEWAWGNFSAPHLSPFTPCMLAIEGMFQNQMEQEVFVFVLEQRVFVFVFKNFRQPLEVVLFSEIWKIPVPFEICTSYELVLNNKFLYL